MMRPANILVLATLASGIAWMVPVARCQKPGESILVKVEVTDSLARPVTGLTPRNFRVLEDGIAQKIASFSEGTNPPLIVDHEAAGEPNTPGDSEFLSGGDFYTISYYPDLSNKNEGFRKIEVQILADIGRLRVRHRPGYRPSR